MDFAYVPLQSLSIFLLKEGVTIQSALEDDHGMQRAVAKNAPAGALLYVLETTPSAPDWCRYLGVERRLVRSSVGGILFLDAAGRTFAFTFGHAYRKLSEDSYEYDFGLQVLLNCVDPKKLRSADSINPAASLMKRSQGNQLSELTYLDFKYNEEVLKSLTGKVQDRYRNWFSSATGAANLKLKVKAPASRLPGLCAELMKLFVATSYKDVFPAAQNLCRVRDPADTNRLDALLLDAIRQRSEDVHLAVPEMLDLDGALSARFIGGGDSAVYEDVYLQPFFEYLAANRVDARTLTLDQLQKKYKLRVFDGHGVVRTYTIYKSLLFEAKLPGSDDIYHLLDRCWYRAKAAFVANLDAELDDYWTANPLPNYSHACERDYNVAAAKMMEGVLCLDRTNVSLKGETDVEPCDLMQKVRDRLVLYHVKISTYSFLLSHLFNQGVNAVELLRQEPSARSNLMRLINRLAKPERVSALWKAVDARQFDVVYGIVTHKPQERKSKNLPLFSRITLRRSIKALRGLDANVRFCFIPNERVKARGRTKVATAVGR